MNTDEHLPAKITFYVRQAVKGGYRYDHARTSAQHPGTELRTYYPPRVGEQIDLLVMNPREEEVMYPCRVLDVASMYPAIGSVNWQRGDIGPRFQVIAERATTWFFKDEVALDDDA